MGFVVPRFGVEEEFLVVDPESRAVVPRAADVLGHARQRLGERVGGEITKLQLETRTDPCDTADQLHGQLTEARRTLAEAARAAGLRVMASGTPVLGRLIPPPITEGPRQDLGTATFRGLHDELSICALHVHIELPDRDLAVLVDNDLRVYLPAIIALTANSPYWDERDTGYASWRTVIWNRWPVAGPPPYLTSAAHYESVVTTMLEAGALVDRGTIFWDIRPSTTYPTLEIRAADVPITATESAAFAALVRGLAAMAIRAVGQGDPGPEVPAELMRLAYWRAARDGFAGHGVDPRTGRPAPAPEVADGLLRAAWPALEECGETERVAGWLSRLAAVGTGATRQRRVTERHGRFEAVVDHLVAATVSDEIGDGNLTEVTAPVGA